MQSKWSTSVFVGISVHLTRAHTSGLGWKRHLKVLTPAGFHITNFPHVQISQVINLNVKWNSLKIKCLICTLLDRPNKTQVQTKTDISHIIRVRQAFYLCAKLEGLFSAPCTSRILTCPQGQTVMLHHKWKSQHQRWAETSSHTYKWQGGDLKPGFSESRYSLPNFGVFLSLFCCCDEAPWPETTKGRQVVDSQFQGKRSPAAGSRSRKLHGHIFNPHRKQRE